MISIVLSPVDYSLKCLSISLVLVSAHIVGSSLATLREGLHLHLHIDTDMPIFVILGAIFYDMF